MLALKENQIKYSISNYLESNGRAQQHLDDILQLICRIHQPANLILTMFEAQCSPIKTLKWLILLNRILMSDMVDKKGISDLFELMSPTIKTDFQKILNNKLIKPYILYLQKRSRLEGEELDVFSDCQINLTYSLINTLWVCLSFVDILYTFGRYYTTTYGFFIDFNITLGMDLRLIYYKMVKSIKKEDKKILLKDIQQIHQKMYIVYYNCYFHKYLKNYAPRWMSTEDRSPSSSKSIKTSSSVNSKINVNDFSINSMTQSMVCCPKKDNMEDSRLQIIKSMERIVSLFN